MIVPLCRDLMWLAGAYIGDGWVRINERRGSVIYGVNPVKAKRIAERLDRLGLTATVTTERTTTRVMVHGRALARWMVENFGHAAHEKTIPSWLYGAPMEWRNAFLSGWHAMDGTKGENKITTTSKRLQVGLVTLLSGMGKTPSVTETAPSTWSIEGRSGVSRRYWNIRWKDQPETRTAFRRGWLLFGRVRSVTPAGMGLVFNLEVEEDNSYVADGVVVHNCQAFSVAGLRKALDDPRGQLTLTYLAVVERYRPRWVVWENVPGVLSADRGRAFGAFLGALAELGYGFAWRVLDAQYVRVDGFCRAVPQRRRRVFLVGHSGGRWAGPGEVLFECESLSGHPPPRREAWEEAAGGPETGLATGGDGGGARQVDEAPTALIPPVANTVTASANRWGSSLPDNGQTAIIEVANTLTARMHKGINTTVDEGQTPIVVNARMDPVHGSIPGALDTDGGTWAVQERLRVRRLTPRECERLQGFPDDWTLVPDPRGQPMSDTQRYRLLGNSMAANVMRWIGFRLQMAEERTRGMEALTR